MKGNQIAELEALLFYYGEPIPMKKIVKLLGIKIDKCEELVEELANNLKKEVSSGLTLIERDDEVQLATKPELKHLVQKLVQEEFREELTPAALESLAIIAYLGPIPRSTLDYVRGVNSSFTLRSLLMRGLVDRKVNPEKGNVYYYQASFDFLKHIGLSKIDDLPEYGKYKDLLAKFEISNSPSGGQNP